MTRTLPSCRTVVVPADLVDSYRRSQADVVTLANRDLLAVWRTLDLDDAETATATLLPAMRDVTGAYGGQAAAVAADFYDDARTTVAAPGRFVAAPAAAAPVVQVDILTRWAVGPLWSTDPRYGDALGRLSGEAGKLIRSAGHNTITGAAASDPQASGWRRRARPGACKFCVMLADRGAVYRQTTAEFASHANCGCVAVPAWDDGREASPVQYVASTSTRSPEQRAQLRAYLNANYPNSPG